VYVLPDCPSPGVMLSIDVTPKSAFIPVAAGQAASNKSASVVSAHTAVQINSVVTLQTADRSAAVAVALWSCPKR
jgi:hypothetical protein